MTSKNKRKLKCLVSWSQLCHLRKSIYSVTIPAIASNRPRGNKQPNIDWVAKTWEIENHSNHHGERKRFDRSYKHAQEL